MHFVRACGASVGWASNLGNHAPFNASGFRHVATYLLKPVSLTTILRNYPLVAGNHGQVDQWCSSAAVNALEDTPVPSSKDRLRKADGLGKHISNMLGSLGADI